MSLFCVLWLKKNPEFLKKFYENIDWSKIKEETELTVKSNAESTRATATTLSTKTTATTESALPRSTNSSMKLQVKDKVKNFYKTNNPYKSTALNSGLASTSTTGGLHWINIATTNAGLKKASTTSTGSLNSSTTNVPATQSSTNVAKELIRIINNVTTLSNTNLDTVNPEIEPLLSPSTENLNSSITISTIGGGGVGNSVKNAPVNRLHFLKVDGQRVDYLHSIQSSNGVSTGTSRKTQSSIGMPNQAAYKMSLPKATLSPSMSSLNSVSTANVSNVSNTNTIGNAPPPPLSNSHANLNSPHKKSNTNIIDLGNYRAYTNLDFIKQTVRETFEVRDGVKFPDLANMKNSLDVTALSNYSVSDK